MLSWLRSKFGRTVPPGQPPGEDVDVARTLDEVLRQNGRETRLDGAFVNDVETGLAFLPLLDHLQPIPSGGSQTRTTIEIRNAVFPDPIFEYQHSTGPDVAAAIRAGFESWMELDFVTLREAVRPAADPDPCSRLTMTNQNGSERSIILGPLQYYEVSGVNEPHPRACCQFCLFTAGLDVWQPLVEATGWKAIRLFAARKGDGSVDADCRVNGGDFEPGRQALLAHAASWAGPGLAVRKQYIIIRDAIPPPASSRDH